VVTAKRLGCCSNARIAQLLLILCNRIINPAHLLESSAPFASQMCVTPSVIISGQPCCCSCAQLPQLLLSYAASSQGHQLFAPAGPAAAACCSFAAKLHYTAYLFDKL
jgi:hypothetical protein